MHKKYNTKVKILVNKKSADGYFKLLLNAPSIAKIAKPGQFIHILISDAGKPFLRRPFSIHRIRHKEFVEILYKTVGFGTQVLSLKKPGERLDIIGPLGNSFDYSLVKDRRPILIAGGMGMAPLVFLADRMSKRGALFFDRDKRLVNRGQPLVLIGARTKKEILCIREFQQFGFHVKVATEDGSLGFKGRVTSLLKNVLSSIKEKELIFYTCGPKLMVGEIAKISKKKKIASFASLEEIMACGIGACLGCAIKMKQGYKLVCKDGPVFNVANIDWRG